MIGLEEQISILIRKGCVTPPSIRDTEPGQVCWTQPTGLAIAMIAEISDMGIEIWINDPNVFELPNYESWQVLARGNPVAIHWQPDQHSRTRAQGVSQNTQVSVFKSNVIGSRDNRVLATLDVA